MAQNDEYILEILLETGLATKSQIERARAEKKEDEAVADVLISQGVVSQEDVTKALASHAAMDFVDISAFAVPEDIVQMLPRDLARRFKVIPRTASFSVSNVTRPCTARCWRMRWSCG